VSTGKLPTNLDEVPKLEYFLPKHDRMIILTSTRQVKQEQDGLVDLTRQVAVLEERMNTITESYDRGWKLIEAKMGEDNAKLEARLGNDIAKLREDSAKSDRNLSIQIYAVAFGIIIVILGIGGTIISLLV